MSEGARAIQGKPGSGKTCYAVYLITLLLSDWAQYKKREGVEFGRTLYTNIPLDMAAANEYLSRKTGFEVDVSARVVLLGDAFFCDENGDFCEWWEKFQQDSYIIIDEFQFLLSSSSKKDKEGKDHTERFMLYISKHRHRGHELILMSQSVKNITIEARRQFAVIQSVLNIKNITLGRWPFSVPMQDIDVVREAWGMKAQFAHIKRGVFVDDKVEFDKGYEPFLLRPALFKLYKSMTMVSEVLERPTLKLGKLGSLIWITKKHGIRLGVCTLTAITLFIAFVSAVVKFPEMMMDTLVSDVPANKPKVVTKTASTVTTPDGEVRQAAPSTPADDEIIGFVLGGVITPRGILRKDDHLTFEGEKDYVKSVDVRRGVVHFGSGKKLQK